MTPSPTRTHASNGSAAASPHTPTGLPRSLPARATLATRFSTAGCHGSVNAASSADIRSAAIVYCVRSLGADRDEVDFGQDRGCEVPLRRGSDHHTRNEPAAAYLGGEFSASPAPAIIGAITTV